MLIDLLVEVFSIWGSVNSPIVIMSLEGWGSVNRPIGRKSSVGWVSDNRPIGRTSQIFGVVSIDLLL